MTSATMAADRQKKKKDRKKKKDKKRNIFLGIAGAVGLIIWWGTQPLVGTMQYGVCKTFIETQLYYPRTLRINSVSDFDRSLRVYYTYIDPFGQSRMDFTECTFAPTSGGTGNMIISSIEMNRQPVSQEKLDAFNQTIPAILAYPPDLIIPVYEDALKNITIAPRQDLLK